MALLGRNGAGDFPNITVSGPATICGRYRAAPALRRGKLAWLLIGVGPMPIGELSY